MSQETKIHRLNLDTFPSKKGWYITITFTINQSSDFFDIFYNKSDKENLVDALVSYDEKTDVFSYSQAVTNNSASIGILNYLKELQDGKVEGRYSLESNILRCLEALDNFWD